MLQKWAHVAVLRQSAIMSSVCTTVDEGRNASQSSPEADILVFVQLIRSLEKPIRILLRVLVSRLSRNRQHVAGKHSPCCWAVLCIQNGKTPLLRC